jgi:UDP-perosamine 4-acetyltransferase
MMLRRVVMVGAGGHAKVVVEAVRAMGVFEIVGLTDPAPAAPEVLGVPVLGSDEVLAALYGQGIREAVLAVGDNRLRQELARMAFQLGFTLPPIIHPHASISPSARIRDGAVVMARAVVGTEATVHEAAIINTGAILDHETVIGPAAHVAPGCALAGRVTVGERALVGAGAAVRPRIVIGADAVVATGAAVVDDVPPGVLVGGVPARPLRQAAETVR